VTLALAFVLAAESLSRSSRQSRCRHGHASTHLRAHRPPLPPNRRTWRRRRAGRSRRQPAAPAPDTTQHRLPGSTLLHLAQIRDAYGPADCYRAIIPCEIVAKGGGATDYRLRSLPLPERQRSPENAGVSGCPDYFVQTMLDSNDARKSATLKANTNRMIAFAKAMTDDEIRPPRSFSSMNWTPWIQSSKPIPCRRPHRWACSRAEGAGQKGTDRTAHY
jgi:hypothetical protein